MIKIPIPERDLFDERNEEFLYCPGVVLKLEHSLLAISKWEAKWKVPFISKNQKTIEQTIDYIRCMTLNEDVPPIVYRCLTNADISKIDDYIADKMTAAVFADDKKGSDSGEFTTSETIYYWMICLGIPFECESWNFNKLFALIQFCSAKNQPTKKLSMREIYSRNNALNAKRKAGMMKR